ncbi:MAG: hypothetical protein IJE91_03435 [Clostridia bacterium]|nr:hypothetical protein [Clostridia bacterium]
MEELKSNTTQAKGEYTCLYCGTHLDLDKLQTLPPCPNCGGGKFKKEE